MNACECGCGLEVKKGNKFIWGHHWKGKKRGPQSEDHRKKLSDSHVIYWDNPELRNKESERMKVIFSDPNSGNNQYLRRRWSSEENRKRQAEFKRRDWKNPEFRSDTTQKIVKVWSDPEYKERTVRAMRRAESVRPTKPELELDTLLNAFFPNEYKYTGDGSFILGGKNPDFIHVAGQKKIIEMWGDYWHQGENPEDRAQIFRPFGFQTLVIWESELSNPERVISRIKEFA